MRKCRRGTRQRAVGRQRETPRAPNGAGRRGRRAPDSAAGIAAGGAGAGGTGAGAPDAGRGGTPTGASPGQHSSVAFGRMPQAKVSPAAMAVNAPGGVTLGTQETGAYAESRRVGPERAHQLEGRGVHPAGGHDDHRVRAHRRVGAGRKAHRQALEVLKARRALVGPQRARDAGAAATDVNVPVGTGRRERSNRRPASTESVVSVPTAQETPAPGPH